MPVLDTFMDRGLYFNGSAEFNTYNGITLAPYSVLFPDDSKLNFRISRLIKLKFVSSDEYFNANGYRDSGAQGLKEMMSILDQ